MKYEKLYKINSGKRKGTPKISISIKVEGDIDKVLENITSISDVFDTVNNTTKTVLDNIEIADNFNTTKTYNMEIGQEKKNVYYDLAEPIEIPTQSNVPVGQHVKEAYEEFIKTANEFLKLDPKSEGYIDKLDKVDGLYRDAYRISTFYHFIWAEPIEAFILATKLNQIKYELGYFYDKPVEE